MPRSKFRLLILLSILTVSVYAQEAQLVSLKPGDPAPPLWVRRWVKGEPVQQFQKGQVYVLEFWATWCKPCAAAMPRLSALAGKYRNQVTVIGIDVYEKKATSVEKVKAFVDSMGQRMDYNVAVEDSNLMETGWLAASGEQNNGIPRSFIVNAEGRFAWSGYPTKLEEGLPKIINNSWNIEEVLAKLDFDKHLERVDDSAGSELIRYAGDLDKEDLGKPDSALLVIHEITRNEPKLTYAPRIAFYTFSSLLKTDPHKAYEHGKLVLATPTYEDPAYDEIINTISMYSDLLKLPGEIYQLGAEACQLKIDQFPFPELIDLPRLYNRMAAWYWLANNKSKAIDAQQKAVEELKSRNAAEVAGFESRLNKYRN